jgi:hypothetical protein
MPEATVEEHGEFPASERNVDDDRTALIDAHAMVDPESQARPM